MKTDTTMDTVMIVAQAVMRATQASHLMQEAEALYRTVEMRPDVDPVVRAAMIGNRLALVALEASAYARAGELNIVVPDSTDPTWVLRQIEDLISILPGARTAIEAQVARTMEGAS
jgi:hypothetical protein